MTAPSVRLPAAAGKRPDIEADLRDKYAVEFLYMSNVNTDDFDVERSQANQARFEPIDQATVDLYQEGVGRGDAFPAVLAYRPGRGARPKLVVVDGNHRLMAHIGAGRPINVYEIDRRTKAATIVAMTFAFNTKHGRPTTEEERVSQALYLVANGATQENAAAIVSVPLRILKRAVGAAKSDARAAETNVDPREWESLPKAVRHKLNGVSTDEGFAAASHLAFQAGLVSDEVAELVGTLNTSRNAAKQKAHVRAETDRYRERIQISGGGLTTGSGRTKRHSSPRTQFAMVIGQIAALPDDIAGLANTFAAAERHEAASRAEDASQRLHKLALELDPTLK